MTNHRKDHEIIYIKQIFVYFCRFVLELLKTKRNVYSCIEIVCACTVYIYKKKESQCYYRVTRAILL